jgi:hypothetical protein
MRLRIVPATRPLAETSGWSPKVLNTATPRAKFESCHQLDQMPARVTPIDVMRSGATHVDVTSRTTLPVRARPMWVEL